ncbi:Sua5/YciO/YrdC/YwlC family protein, partial [Candidatus Gracilibacteria bacterium]|nr:Sua5/YciO/YrdC/YwlC family protein [Candidatus Gracilibacteria bacterium]
MTAKIFVVPTDTCIGIGCRLDDREGYELIYKLKGRDAKKPLAIIVPTWDELLYETTLTPSQINFLKTYKFPFTIVCEIRDDFRDEYPLLDDAQYKTVGFRVGEACLKPET